MNSGAQQFHQPQIAQIGQRGQHDQPDLSLGSRLPWRASSAPRASARQPLSATGRNAMLTVGMVAALSLTASFAHVVQSGTEQAQVRHRHEAYLAEMAWRCNALADTNQQSLCKARAGLDGRPTAVAASADTSQLWALTASGLASR